MTHGLQGASLLDGGFNRGTGLMQQLLGFAQRRFNGMKTFGDPSTLFGDLQDAEIKLLKFDERGQVLVQ